MGWSLSPQLVLSLAALACVGRRKAVSRLGNLVFTVSFTPVQLLFISFCEALSNGVSIKQPRARDSHGSLLLRPSHNADPFNVNTTRVSCPRLYVKSTQPIQNHVHPES